MQAGNQGQPTAPTEGKSIFFKDTVIMRFEVPDHLMLDNGFLSNFEKESDGKNIVFAADGYQELNEGF